MKCENCGFDLSDDAIYCRNCGAEVLRPKPVVLNPAVEKLVTVFKDKLVILACILLSVSSIIMIATKGLPIFHILSSVFLWLLYSQAKKGRVKVNQLCALSGTVYAYYVFLNVVYILMIILFLIITILFSFYSPNVDSLLEAMKTTYGFEINSAYIGTWESLLSGAVIVLGIVCILIAAGGLILNIIGMRKIHRFIKSTYQGILVQSENFYNPKSAKFWLLFFGIESALGAIINLLKDGVLSAVARATWATALIIGAVIINKHFISKEN